MRQGHRRQRHAVLPKQRQRQSPQHRKNRRPSKQGDTQEHERGPRRKGRAVKLRHQSGAAKRQRQTGQPLNRPCPRKKSTTCTQLDPQQSKAQRHAGLAPPNRYAIGQHLGGLALTVHQAPAAHGQHATNQGGQTVSQALRPGVDHAAWPLAVSAHAAAHRGQVAMSLGCQSTPHRQHQTQVLHQDRGVFDALAHPRAHGYFNDRNQHHQGQRCRRQPFVDRPSALAWRFRLGLGSGAHLAWPAR